LIFSEVISWFVTTVESSVMISLSASQKDIKELNNMGLSSILDKTVEKIELRSLSK